MIETVIDDFKKYTDFSVRVDRFFNVANIYGMYHNALKFTFESIPELDIAQTTIKNEDLAEGVKKFLVIAINNLNYIDKDTNIFTGAGGGIDRSKIPEDMLNFSFYTCYCFQWTLFENFIKKMVNKLIEEGILPSEVAKEIKKRSGQTKKFLDYIESGEVFGHSPFRTALFTSPIETCAYDDLNKIRELRNNFIHGIETPEITADNIKTKQDYYIRSMWILRLFASNVSQDVQRKMKEYNKI